MGAAQPQGPLPAATRLANAGDVNEVRDAHSGRQGQGDHVIDDPSHFGVGDDLDTVDDDDLPPRTFGLAFLAAATTWVLILWLLERMLP